MNHNGWRVYSSNTQDYHGYSVERQEGRVQISLNRLDSGEVTPVAYFPSDEEAERFIAFFMDLRRTLTAVPNRAEE
jgi:hypothetical protein